MPPFPRSPRSLCIVLALAWPSLALAGLPGGFNSSAPQCITLVGSRAGVPDAAAGSFTVEVRDLANNPVAGAAVVIDLSGATDMSLCADQLDPTASVDCANKTVKKFTGANGSVNFTVLGASNGGGNATTLLHGGKIFANGTLIASPTVAAYDLDGSGGVGANDLAAWLNDFGSGNNFGRCDYDCSGGIGANDFSFWLTEFGFGTSTESCASHCP